MPKPPSQSLTVRANGGLLPALKTDCFVSEAFDPKAAPDPLPVPHTFNAIWDTGASITVITQRVVDECRLQSIGPALTYGVGGRHETEAYLVNIMLLSQVGFAGMRVIRGELPAGTDLLIGMDIITQGDFCITNQNRSTVFSFRVPSVHTVDYVHEHATNALHPPQTHGGQKANRPKKPKTFGKDKRR